MEDFRNRKLGMLDEKHLSTDYNLRTIGVMADGNYPSTVSRIIEHPIHDQGMTSMCFAFATARILETQNFLETGEVVNISEGSIYANKFNGFGGEGMIPIFDLDIFRKIGALRKEEFNVFGDYNVVRAEYDKLDKNTVIASSAPFRALTWLRLDNIEIIPYLHRWKGCVVSIDVYDNFYGVKGDSVVPLPVGNNNGGHAMYGDEIKREGDELFICGDNSWGEGWGNKGRFKINLKNPIIKAFYGLVDVTPVTNEIVLEIGSKVMYTSKGNVELPIAPLLVGGNTMVPLRAISEMFGKDVKWIPSNKDFAIGSKIIISMSKRDSDMLII